MRGTVRFAAVTDNNNPLVIQLEIRNSRKAWKKTMRCESVFQFLPRRVVYQTTVHSSYGKHTWEKIVAIARRSTYQWRFPSFVSWRPVATSFPDSSRTRRKRRKFEYERLKSRTNAAGSHICTYVCIKSHAHACYIVSCAPLTSGRVRCVSRNQEKGKARNCLDRSLERRRVSNTTLPRYYWRVPPHRTLLSI